MILSAHTKTWPSQKQDQHLAHILRGAEQVHDVYIVRINGQTNLLIELRGHKGTVRISYDSDDRHGDVADYALDCIAEATGIGPVWVSSGKEGRLRALERQNKEKL